MNNKHQLMHDVFSAEIEEINQRKILSKDGEIIYRRDHDLIDFEAILLPHDKRSKVLNEVLEEIKNSQSAWEADQSVAHRGLIGLAFSGGGIRSATVNLGILQGLRKLGLLKAVDYLSTVSGGGYIGSCYSAVNAAEAKLQTNADDKLQAIAHDALFQHKPGVPENPIFRHLRNNANYMAPNGLIDVLRVPSVFLRGMAINFFIVFPFLLMLAALSALLISAPGNWHQQLAVWIRDLGIPLSEVGTRFSVTITLAMLTVTVYLLSPLVSLLLQSKMLKEKGNAGWLIRSRASRFLGWCLAAIFACAAIELQPWAVALYRDKLGQEFSFQEIALIGSFGSLGLSAVAARLLPQIANVLSRMGIYLLGLIGFLVFWLFYLHLSNDLLHPMLLQQTGFVWISPAGFTVIAMILLSFNWLTGNTNFTSISRFYRDRLSKAYIFGFNGKAEIEQTDDLKLSALDSNFAPYHLLNSTLNLSRTSQAYCDDRRGDFFFFSKRYIGSLSTGYCKTSDMEAHTPELNLATAMAISAAAAAPNLGKSTIKPLVFILGMLNIRYDYWLQNPGWIKQGKASSDRPNPSYFLRELASNLSADTAYVNLSDGGHIENLGIYELIRRECRLIIAGDSEEDQTLTFSGLADLIRLVQIDFGVIIVMDGLDDIRNGKQHHAIGTIYYCNEKVGKLIYLKTSLLGDFSLRDSLAPDAYLTSQLRTDDVAFDNNPYIAHYKTQDPTFPHQSSANQFYDETQFECYRALGFQIATNSLGQR